MMFQCTHTPLQTHIYFPNPRSHMCFPFCFHFTTPTVLTNLSLILPQGTITAIVGRSGSGKSTVAALLSRFYQPDEGTITLGGINATQFSQQQWTQAVAMVSQEPVLFAGTIEDNIAYGSMCHRSRGDVQRAAMAANAHDFISALPDGYDTMVGEGGVLLSGGQRQRIAVARALLKVLIGEIVVVLACLWRAIGFRFLHRGTDNMCTGRTDIDIGRGNERVGHHQ